MNAMLSSIRRHHITRVVLSLLMVALIAGATGCVGEVTRTVKYDLTIASSQGGSVSEPGEGTFTCDSGRVVDLVAVPTSGFRFDRWTGDVDTIANANAASTTITMSGNYSIRATFEETEATFHTLTVGITGSGETSPTAGQHTYSAGTVVTITATAASGYRFVQWTGDVATIDDPDSARTTITIYGAYSITANFEQTAVTYYTLTMAATGGGSINPAVGQHSYAAGTVVPIIASSAGGYYFVNWTGSVGTIANVNAASTTITMNDNYSITANFAVLPPGQYGLTISSGAGGSVTSPGEGTFIYGAGTVINLVATPAGAYEFVNWTGNVGTIANVTAASTTITMNGNYLITANFYAGPPVPYNLTISSSAGGSVTTPGEGTFGYGSGMVVNLVASPLGGYRFVNWTGNVGTVANVTAASTTITMNSNYSITANFAVIPPGQYSLTISSTAGGSVTTPGEGVFTRNAGTVVNLVASPLGGYRFVNWTGNVGTVANVTAASTTITMNSNYSITANFAVIPPIQYSLTISSTAGGSVSTPGEGTFIRNAGTVVNLAASPHTGYRFVSWTGNVGTIANDEDPTTTIAMNDNYSITANFETINFIISAGERHTVGVRSDGTVVAVGDNGRGQCNVGSWTNIVQVAAEDYRTVGLKSDGTVVAVGANDYGECNVAGWTNIVQVSTGGYHTVGLRSNGTVAAVGDNGIGQCNVGSWTNIVQVATGLYHTVGVKSDGTVVAVGYNDQGQCNVGSWTNIVQVAAGVYHTVGVKSDGTVVAVGYNDHGQCNVGGWMDIIHVAAGWYHTVGTKSDGTVVAVGANWWDMSNVSSWADIVQVGAGAYHTVGVKSDGKVVAAGANLWGQCYVGDWDLN
jgi:hypothetical protein